MDYILGVILGGLIYFICLVLFDKLMVLFDKFIKQLNEESEESKEETIKSDYWNFKFRGIDIAKLSPKELCNELIQKGFNKIDDLHFNGTWGELVEIEIIPYKDNVHKLIIKFKNGFDIIKGFEHAYMDKYSGHKNFYITSIGHSFCNTTSKYDTTHLCVKPVDSIIEFYNPHVLDIMKNDEKEKNINKYKDII